MANAKRKSKSDKQSEKLLREAVTKNMMRQADEKYRELTEYGQRSLTVFWRVPYQMVDMGSKFVFVEIPGYYTDDPHQLDPAAIYRFEALRERMPRARRHFSIAKQDIVRAEIGGEFCGYFDRLCGTLTLDYRKGTRQKRLTLYLPGANNHFTVRQFLDGIDVTIRPDAAVPKGGKGRWLDKKEPTVIGSLLLYFNRKGRAVNAVNGILSILSVLLTVAGAVVPWQGRDILRGIGALLPAVIYLNYIRYNGLLSLFVTSLRRKTVYHKCKPACFGKIAIPTVALLLLEAVEFSFLAGYRRFLVLSIALGYGLSLLYDFLVPRNDKNWLRRGVAAAALCLFYAFMAVPAVNRLSVSEVSREVLEYPDSYAYETHSGDDTFWYCGLFTPDGEYSFSIDKGDYERLERHALSAQAKKYRGWLGVTYYEFELVEASEEAQRHSAYLESLPKLPPNPTEKDLEEYRRQSQAFLQKIEALAEKNGLLVSGSDQAS